MHLPADCRPSGPTRRACGTGHADPVLTIWSAKRPGASRLDARALCSDWGDRSGTGAVDQAMYLDRTCGPTGEFGLMTSQVAITPGDHLRQVRRHSGVSRLGCLCLSRCDRCGPRRKLALMAGEHGKPACLGLAYLALMGSIGMPGMASWRRCRSRSGCRSRCRSRSGCRSRCRSRSRSRSRCRSRSRSRSRSRRTRGTDASCPSESQRTRDQCGDRNVHCQSLQVAHP